MEPFASIRWIMAARVMVSPSGSAMRRIMLLAGDGKSPRIPGEMIFFPLSVLVVFSWIPTVWKNSPKARRARRPAFFGSRAPKSSKYQISGIPKILLKRTANGRGKQF